MNSDGNPSTDLERVSQPFDCVDHVPVNDGTMYTLHLLPFYTEGCALGRNLEYALDQALLLSLESPHVIDNEAPNMPAVGHNYVEVEGVAPPLMSQEEEVAKFANYHVGEVSWLLLTQFHVCGFIMVEEGIH